MQARELHAAVGVVAACVCVEFWAPCSCASGGTCCATLTARDCLALVGDCRDVKVGGVRLLQPRNGEVAL